LKEKPTLLVTSSFVRGRFEEVSRLVNVISLAEIEEGELDKVLPEVDCLLVQGDWPDSLTPRRLSSMGRLRFIQSGWAGVNHIPFQHLGKRVVVCSNAGGFSTGVAEFALTLLLASSKRLVKLDSSLRSREFTPEKWGSLARDVVLLNGKTLGVLGYGGIGRAVASMGKALGMKVVAFSRHPERERAARVLAGSQGLLKVLKTSDAVVIALPLSKLTVGLIGRSELESMKTDGILVNIARAEVVDEESVYRHLVSNPSFTYATDVWRLKDGKETFSSAFPFLELPNFIGTPHVAGASSAMTGEPGRVAVENVLRFLEGRQPLNIVNAKEYA